MAPPTIPFEDVRSANASLVAKQSLVGVFVGGTSGIGEYILRALAGHCSQQGKGLRVYIVGRNEQAATTIISDCQKLCPQSQFQFIQVADLSLITDVDRCCEQVKKLEQGQSNDHARVDFLLLSHADLHFGGRRETTEGLDKSMSLLYYSRIRFILKLMPLLRESSVPACVVSVYAGGMEASGKLFTDDLSLRDPSHFSFANVRSTVVHMKTMAFETIAEQNRGRVRLIHVFPGLVVTPAFNSGSLPLWFRVIWTLVSPFAGWFSVPPNVIGERVLGFMSDRYPSGSTEEQIGSSTNLAKSTDDIMGGGAYSTKYEGHVNSVQEAYKTLRKENFRNKVWEHTAKAFEQIEGGIAFKE